MPTSHVLELLNKSSWFVNIKSMQVGFMTVKQGVWNKRGSWQNSPKLINGEC